MPNPETTPPAQVSAALTLVERAEAFLAAGEIERALDILQQAAAGQDIERTWLVHARAHFAMGDYKQAFAGYRVAISLAVDPQPFLAPMGEAALLLGEHAMAEEVLGMAVKAGVGGEGAILDLAWSQARQTAFDRAQNTLRTALQADPARPRLWCALGEILQAQGRHADALTFLQEALRLDPASGTTRAALAEVLSSSEDHLDQAMTESARAMAEADGEDFPRVVAGHARRLLASGSVPEGFQALARGMEPGTAAEVEVKAAAQLWESEAPIRGRLLVIGEQDLSDEILFSQVLAAFDAANQRVIFTAHPEWRRLAERSFPHVVVAPQLWRVRFGRQQVTAQLDSPHVHAGALVGAWTTLRSLLAIHRVQPGDFVGDPYLKADPQRVAHWGAWLAGLGPGLKVGVRWLSNRPEIHAWRGTPPLSLLQEALRQPGIRVVSLQDGEASAEVDALETAGGVTIHQPLGLDSSDLDDLAALTRALDLVVGAPDAVTYMAAACGAQTWFLAPPRHWALLGQPSYPWFPSARVIPSAGSGDWRPAITALSEALAATTA